MSSEIAIRAENIGKRYRIGATQGVGRYRSLREDLTGLATKSRRKARAGRTGFLGAEGCLVRDQGAARRSGSSGATGPARARC